MGPISLVILTTLTNACTFSWHMAGLLCHLTSLYSYLTCILTNSVRVLGRLIAQTSVIFVNPRSNKCMFINYAVDWRLACHSWRHDVPATYRCHALLHVVGVLFLLCDYGRRNEREVCGAVRWPAMIRRLPVSRYHHVIDVAIFCMISSRLCGECVWRAVLRNMDLNYTCTRLVPPAVHHMSLRVFGPCSVIWKACLSSASRVPCFCLICICVCYDGGWCAVKSCRSLFSFKFLQLL